MLWLPNILYLYNIQKNSQMKSFVVFQCKHTPKYQIEPKVIYTPYWIENSYISATVTIRALCPITMEDYKNILQDIFDSEELKTDS